MAPSTPVAGRSRAPTFGALAEGRLQSWHCRSPHPERSGGLLQGRPQQGREQNGLGTPEFFYGGGGVRGGLRALHGQRIDVWCSWHAEPMPRIVSS